MQINWGIDASTVKGGNPLAFVWNSQKAVNGHMLICGMSGSGKTYTLRRAIKSMLSTQEKVVGGLAARVHIFDVHGDIKVDGQSTVMFSEQTKYGMNPLRVNPDQHFGGVRKRIQEFISTMNRVMTKLGSKQEACLRNVLTDVYQRHGFKPDDHTTWTVDETMARLLSDGSDGRLYLDVPIGEKDDAKALGAMWDGLQKCWWVPSDQYRGGLLRWSPKTLARTHPSIADATRMARHILQMSFLGTGAQAITYLEAANRAAEGYQRKRLEALRRGNSGFIDEKLQADLEKAKQKAIDTFTDYANAITTGHELDDVMKYDSNDVLKGVVDRLDNLDAIGIFSATPPPFDPKAAIWNYNIRALGLEQRKLFVLFRLAEIFDTARQRGEQDHISDIIILDEAHIYADDDENNIINTLAKEARKFGVALICASQSPTHFTEDFIAAVSTKIILGIDEQYWKGAQSKMRVTEEALKWIKPQKTILVQMKTKGEARNDWKWIHLSQAA